MYTEKEVYRDMHEEISMQREGYRERDIYSKRYPETAMQTRREKHTDKGI